MGGYTLIVRVESGRNMVIRDILTSDPYCILRYKDPGYAKVQEKRTSTCHSTLNPTWGEKLFFMDVGPRGRLKLEVWDEDLPKSWPTSD